MGMSQDSFLTALLAWLVVILTYYFMKYLWRKSDIRQRIRKRQQVCRDAFHALEEHLEKNGISETKQKQILALRLAELVAKLKAGELKSVEVLKAYQAKALAVHGKFNCLVEPLDEAEEFARASDVKKTRGLLEGVPISLKENINVQGYESTGGLLAMLGQAPREDGTLVKVLRHQGAIPFVKTNIPQTMLSMECSNPMYGQTVNPYNVLRGPGGSSGGEAALLAAGGSILGIGNDIGGSIRVPCQMCGVCGLKPTAGRLSGQSTFSARKGQTLVKGSAGPMAKDVDSLALTMEALLCPLMFELEPEVPPIPFRSEIYQSTKPLRIGYYTHDGYLPCIPAVERALMETKAKLEMKGHTLVPFTPPRVLYVMLQMIKIMYGDNFSSLTPLLSDDILDYSFSNVYNLSRMPRIIIRILASFMDFHGNDPALGRFLIALKETCSVTEWWQLATNQQDYRQEFLSVWRASDLDAVICPPAAVPAAPHRAVGDVIGAFSYSSLYNYVNYPAGTVPVTKVTTADQVKMKDYPNKRWFEKNIKKFYSADTEGLPVGVQCVALPYQEELVLRVMKEIESAMADD